MELEIALNFVNNILLDRVQRELRPPEITIFRGTWEGMTYEQMANSSSYSANYLMRDIAPKFWRLLSEALGENVGKNSLKLTLTKLYGSPQINEHKSFQIQVDRANQLSSSLVTNWHNAPVFTSHFYGYDRELVILQRWATVERCSLLGLWGLSGVGKTALMKRLREEIGDRFDRIIWRSLDRSPTLDSLIADILQSEFALVEKDPSLLLPRLLAQMQSQSCLILLDSLETLLQAETLSGKYRPGYEDYETFFRVVGENSHQSCVVVTSLENFNGIFQGITNDALIRSLKISGLSPSDAELLLTAAPLKTPELWQNLIEYYQGNPAMLTIAAQMIQELFCGNVSEFLGQKSLVFGEIDRLLQKSFCRLSVLEREISYWLASEAKPMPLKEIKEGIPWSVYPVELIEALESLIQRAILETQQREERSVFVLPPMIQEFVTNQFIAQIGHNFSVETRNNFLLSDKTIELSASSKKPTHLSQWLTNNFELGWQPIEALFTATVRSPARLRSAFNLRGEEVVTRFKQIELATEESVAVLLLIAIAPEASAFRICVQAQPTPGQNTLPPNLQLNLVDGSDTVLAQIVSEAADNFIQLPYFRGAKTEEFIIRLNLNAASYEEDFVL